jgi:hypothetical protein
MMRRRRTPAVFMPGYGAEKVINQTGLAGEGRDFVPHSPELQKKKIFPLSIGNNPLLWSKNFRPYKLLPEWDTGRKI